MSFLFPSGFWISWSQRKIKICAFLPCSDTLCKSVMLLAEWALQTWCLESRACEVGSRRAEGGVSSVSSQYSFIFNSTKGKVQSLPTNIANSPVESYCMGPSWQLPGKSALFKSWWFECHSLELRWRWMGESTPQHSPLEFHICAVSHMCTLPHTSCIHTQQGRQKEGIRVCPDTAVSNVK